jgi:hypothetical protein
MLDVLAGWHGQAFPPRSVRGSASDRPLRSLPGTARALAQIHAPAAIAAIASGQARRGRINRKFSMIDLRSEMLATTLR